MMLTKLRPAVRDLTATLLYGLGVTRPGPAGASRLNVVTFHRVLPSELLRDYALPEIAVSVEEFRWFVDFFASSFTVGTLTEVCRRWNGGERPSKPFLAVTFDDGQRDNSVYARPVLEAAGMRGSFFVPVQAILENGTLWHDRLAYAAAHLVRTAPAEAKRWLGKVGLPSGMEDRAAVREVVERAKKLNPAERDLFVADVEAAAGGPCRPDWDGMMSWDELRALVKAGHEVGSHSMTHQILIQLDDAALEYEVARSRQVLEQHLGSPVVSFVYPNGDCDARVVRCVERAGYKQAATGRWGPNAPGTGPYELTRCDVQGKTARSRSGALSKTRVAFRLSPLHPAP